MTPPSKSHAFRPDLENLEDRTLLATQLTATLQGTTLKIEGTEGGNQIVVRQVAGRISIDGLRINTSAGQVNNVAATQVTKLDIRTLGGNDTVRLNSEATAGQQAITAQAFVQLGSGDDGIVVGKGNAEVWGGDGNDNIEGNDGADYLNGENGNDFLQGKNGNDRIYAGNGNDTLLGAAGNDSLYGGAGSDFLDGGAGADILEGNTGFDTLKDEFDWSRPLPTGAQAADIVQQQSYTCQTLSALVAHMQTGADIASQIVYRGNFQYDVRLFVNGAWQWQRVVFDGRWSDNDPSPPKGSDGRIIPDFYTILFQRARMQTFGINWQSEMSKSQWDAANAASGYRLYSSSDALQAFTGRTATISYPSSSTPQAMVAALNARQAVTASSKTAAQLDPASNIVGWHVYAVQRVYQEGGVWKVQVYNPWGIDGLSSKDGHNDGVVTMTWSEFVRDFSTWTRA